jgi:hypothetical protein
VRTEADIQAQYRGYWRIKAMILFVTAQQINTIFII